MVTTVPSGLINYASSLLSGRGLSSPFPKEGCRSGNGSASVCAGYFVGTDGKSSCQVFQPNPEDLTEKDSSGPSPLRSLFLLLSHSPWHGIRLLPQETLCSCLAVCLTAHKPWPWPPSAGFSPSVSCSPSVVNVLYIYSIQCWHGSSVPVLEEDRIGPLGFLEITGKLKSPIVVGSEVLLMLHS